MAQLSPTQAAWRSRIEAGLRLAEPFLDLVLAAGDRLSRAVDRDDAERPPLRPDSRSARTSLAPGGDGAYGDA